MPTPEPIPPAQLRRDNMRAAALSVVQNIVIADPRGWSRAEIMELARDVHGFLIGAGEGGVVPIFAPLANNVVGGSE